MTSDEPSAAESSRQSHLAAIRRYVGVALAVYWTALFISTHVPLPALPVEAANADKVAHLVGYAGLGVLLSLWCALARPLTIPTTLCVLAILAVYAAWDEWLQQFVNRFPDVNDWVADVTGAAGGVLVIWLLQTLRPLHHRTLEPAGDD